MAWKVRFKFRTAKGISSDEEELSITLGAYSGSIKPALSTQTFKEAKALVIVVPGLPTEDEARDLGQQLKLAVLMWGATDRIGVDPGEDRATGRWGKVVKDLAREHGAQLVDDVHGVHVFESTDKDVVIHLGATAAVHVNADRALGLIANEFAAHRKIPDTEFAALELVNLSEISPDPLAKASLAISAVELLANGATWSEGQKILLRRLEVEAMKDGVIGADEVADAIRRAFRVSVRQSIKRKLSALGLAGSWPVFDDLYNLRSAIFHGGVADRESYAKLAEKAGPICREVVLRAIDIAPMASQPRTDPE